MTSETVRTDILIIGGGGAAARAAYEAKRMNPDLDVLVATEGRWGTGGSTVWVASETLGINAPLNAAGDGDSPEIYLSDMIETGLGLASAELSAIIANESSDRINELIELGVQFDRKDNRILQRKLSGCTRARSLAQGGQTGVSILAVLKRAAIESGVRVVEGVRFFDLLCGNGEVWGARGVKDNASIDIYAKAVVMATGGAGAIFPRNINHASLRGDGFAMAYRAGAQLVNMEFFQIGPGVVYPRMHFIIHSHMWNFRPRLRNQAGREFLKDYIPKGISEDEVLELKSMSFPFSVRTPAKYLDIAISKELLSGGGTQNGGVYFDVNHVSESQLREKAPITYETFLNKGIDLATDAIEIAPLVQNFNGGIKIDSNGATNVAGLFAVGEVSGGVHGADRPGGNNLTDCQVFGYRAGRAAAEFSQNREAAALEKKEADVLTSLNHKEEIAEIKASMNSALMVVRNEIELQSLITQIETFRNKYSPLDSGTDNLLVNAEIFARSALYRKESRGVHYREDFPETDPAFNEPTIVYKDEEGKMVCTKTK